MLTFKSRDFCFTLNKSAIAYIESGKSCVDDCESAVEEARTKYYEALSKMRFAAIEPQEVKKAKDKYTELRLACTVMSIATTGGSIDISVGDLLHIVNNLKKKDSDFHTYIAVSDFVDYIDYKLSNQDMGCVDFEDETILSEFEDFCTDRVDSRKRLITKSVVLKKQSTVKLSDYLIYYFNNDGNYIQTA